MKSLIAIALTLAAPARADGLPGGPDGLIDETMLHPVDAFTGYTLRKNEIIYNQSPLTLPFPSWMWWGVTDRVTVEIDTLPLLGGLFIEPHLPVPSVNTRVGIVKGGADRIAIAVEGMVQHLWREQVQEDLETIRVIRRGTSVFARVNVSIPVHRRFRIHLSGGATWAESFRLENPVAGLVSEYTNAVSPDGSIAFDVRAAPWLSLHATASYGTTFVFSDNQPRKWQLAYGFRIAPARHSSWRILRSLRLEFPSLFMFRPSVDNRQLLPVPIFPYLYWQFQV
ncbi:MAG TPA: hypothetical protein VIU61_12225 [Kofleriaceae bacterium]